MHRLIPLVGLLGLLGLVACTSTRGTHEARQMHWREKVTMPQHMSSALPLESALVDRRDGLLTVQVVVLNNSPATKTYRVRYEWLDEDGRKIDTASESWRRISHPGTTRQYIPGTAPSPLASDWRLSVLDWKN